MNSNARKEARHLRSDRDEPKSSFSCFLESMQAIFSDLKVSYLFIWAIDLWQYLLVRHDPAGDATADIHILYWTVVGVCSSVVALAYWKKPSLAERDFEKRFDSVALCCMVGGTILLFVPCFFSGILTSIIGITLCGVGGAYALLRWLQFFSSLSIKIALGYIIIAYLSLFVFLPLIDLLPYEIKTAMIVALPLLASFMFRKSIKHAPKTEPSPVYYTIENIQGFSKLGLGIAVYSVLLGIRRGFSLLKSDPLMDMLCLGIGVVFFLGVLWWIYGKRRPLDFTRLFQVLLIFLATAVATFPFFPLFSMEFISGCFSAASSIILVLLFMALVDLSGHSSFHPFVVCGVGLGLYGIPRPLGGIAVEYLQVFSSEQYLAVLALFLAYLIIICTAFLFSSRPPGLKSLFHEFAPDTVEPDDFETIDIRCKNLGDCSGLSHREIEVMQLICKGRDKAYIAETLFISENTVRSYAKNVYRKLEVHSKRELLDLVEKQEHAVTHEMR